MKKSGLLMAMLLVALTNEAEATRSAVKRSAAANERHNFTFSELGNEYADFKNKSSLF